MADERWYVGFYIGHLHVAERQRIREGNLNPQEREMLAKGQDPWEHLREPLPPDLRPPTEEQQPPAEREPPKPEPPTIPEAEDPTSSTRNPDTKTDSDKALEAAVQKLKDSPEVQKYLEGQRMVQGFWKSVSDGTAYKNHTKHLSDHKLIETHSMVVRKRGPTFLLRTSFCFSHAEFDPELARNLANIRSFAFHHCLASFT